MADHTIPFTIRVPKATLAKLDKLAKRSYRSRSDLARMAIDAVIVNGVDVATPVAGKEAGQ